MKVIEKKLNEFIEFEKFTNEQWKKRGLISSGSELSNYLNDFFNQCARELIISKKDNYKACLNKRIKQIYSLDYDTEEREFIVDYFLKLAVICSVDLKDDLMKWMYDEDFTNSSSYKKASLEETIHNSCTKCNGALDTKIIEREKGIPDFAYMIIKCNDCSELNLIELGAGIKQFHFGNYTVEDTLPKSEYSKEDAINKLNQLRIEK